MKNPWSLPAARAVLSPDSAIRQGLEAGDTLVEVLVTLVIVGLCAVGIMLAFSGAISASAEHRHLATDNTALQTVTEAAFSHLQQQASPLYVSCSDPVNGGANMTSYYSSKLFPSNQLTGTVNGTTVSLLPRNYTVSVLSVQFWNASASTPHFVSFCVNGALNPPQLLTIQIISPTSGYSYFSFVIDDHQYTSLANVSATQTTISSSTNPSTLGQTTYTANVSVPAPGSGFPANADSVTFLDGSTVLTCASGSGAFNSYSATCIVNYPTTGTHSISAVFGGDAQYAGSTSATLTQTVNRATPTVVVTNVPANPILGQTVQFVATVTGPLGATMPTGTLSWTVGGTGGVTSCASTSGPTAGSSSNVATYTCTIVVVNAGTYTASAALAGDANYNAASSSTDSVLVTANTATVVTHAPSTVTLGQSVTYTATVTGSASTATPSGSLLWTLSGPVTSCTTLTGPTTGSSSNVATYTCSFIALSAGNYAVGASYPGDANYGPSSASDAFTVAKVPTAFVTTVNGGSSATLTYGTPATFAESGLPTGATGTITFAASSPSVTLCTVTNYPTSTSCTTSANLAAGSYSGITASFTDTDGNYVSSLSSNNLSLTVIPAPLTITASSGIMTYGGTAPTITPAYTGLVGGDTAASLSTAPTCSTTATSASPVAGSPYPATCSGAADTNYAISYVAGSVTVTKAILNVAANPASMTYGASALPTFSDTITGFVNGDTSSVVSGSPTLTTTATNSSPAGSYPIATGLGTLSGANYSFNLVNSTLTISPVALTITASNGTKVYGAAAPTITATYSGFVAGDTAASLSTAPTCSSATTTTSSVAGSPYSSTCSGAVDTNYTISYVAGTVSVSRAPLTITASSGSVTYGSSPTVTAIYTGLVGGDTAASLSTAPTCSTTAASSSAPGSYPSSCSGAVDSNYTISYVAGSVTVAKAVLTVAANPASMTYGASALPAFGDTITGYVNGDTSSVVSGSPTLTTTATHSSPAGSYAITTGLGTLTAANYSFVFANGTFTITAAPLTITASSASIPSGTTPPAITAAYSGFVNGDTASSLTGAPTCSTTATSSSGPGTYPSTCANAVDLNYTMTYVAGTVMVTANVTGLAVTSVLLNGVATTPSCGTTLGTSAEVCTVGSGNNNVLSVAVQFVSAAGTPTVFSATTSTAVSYVVSGYSSGSGTLTVNAGATTSSSSTSTSMHATTPQTITFKFGSWSAQITVN